MGALTMNGNLVWGYQLCSSESAMLIVSCTGRYALLVWELDCVKTAQVHSTDTTK